MADFIPVDSPYIFTQDLRYFKANDPYYFKVDNIPIKQLQENCLWLKDQVAGAGDSTVTLTKVNREDFDELRPFVNGDDRVVRVKPGRFSARINDAYDKQSLQILQQIEGGFAGGDIERQMTETDSWAGLTRDNPRISGVYAKFMEVVSTNVLNMNGLTERAFTYPVYSSWHHSENWTETNNGHSIYLSYVNGVGGQLYHVDRPIFPLSEVLDTHYDGATKRQDFVVGTWDQTGKDLGFVAMNRAENEFIKRWRGIFRTAIVDVAEELQITIPDITADNDFYYDATGKRVPLESIANRIDLVFIYSKPIDESETAIAEYISKGSPDTASTKGDGIPMKITKPQLGVCYGAGIGISVSGMHPWGGGLALHEPEHAYYGKDKIMRNRSDVLDMDNGFSGLNIHGSFPSPDDLMTLSPALHRSLTQDSTRFDLVGQSILPVAYIVTLAGSTQVLTNTSLIDIRPFFRTTELAYNERAGIGAAYPQISFANPVVGKAQFDAKISEAYQDLNAKISKNKTAIGGLGGQGGKGNPDTPRIVGSGYVFGGRAFGVEGAMVDRYRQWAPSLTAQERFAKVKEDLGITVHPSWLPDWDVASWCATDPSVTEKGKHLNDYINTWHPGWVGNEGDSFSFASQQYPGHTGVQLKHMGATWMGGDRDEMVGFHFVKKTYTIDNYTPFIAGQNYVVDAQLHGCVPLTSHGWGDQWWMRQAGAAGVWVDIHDKGTKFSIYVAWTANVFDNERPHNPIYRDSSKFTGFAMIYAGAMKNAKKYVPLAICTYPTVRWTVTLIPELAAFHTGKSSILEDTRITLK